MYTDLEQKKLLTLLELLEHSEKYATNGGYSMNGLKEDDRLFSLLMQISKLIRDESERTPSRMTSEEIGHVKSVYEGYKKADKFASKGGYQ